MPVPLSPIRVKVAKPCRRELKVSEDPTVRSAVVRRPPTTGWMLTSLEVLATWLRVHVREERGASLVEYALLLALIAVVCIAAITLLGNNASTSFSRDAASLN